MDMSSARNVHFERSRALGSLNAAPLGSVTSGLSNFQKVAIGSLAIYGGLGFPGSKAVGRELRNIAKYKKRETIENGAILGGSLLVLAGVFGA